MELALRTILFATGATFLHMGVNTAIPNAFNTRLETLLVIALTPYALSMVPGVLGLGDIMKSGMIPLVSLLTIVGITFAVTFLVKEMKDVGGSDALSKYLNDPDDVKVGYARLNREFVTTLAIVLVIDFVVQYLYVTRKRAKSNINVQNQVVKALERFFEKYSTCMPKPKPKS